MITTEVHVSLPVHPHGSSSGSCVRSRRRRTAAGALVACFAAALSATPIASAADRGYELVSPPDSRSQEVGQAVPGQDSAPPSLSPDGSNVLWQSITAGGLVDGHESGGTNVYRSRRTADGWRSDYVGLDGRTTITANVVAADDAFDRLLYRTDNAGGPVDPADPDPPQPRKSYPFSDARLYLRQAGGAVERVDTGPEQTPFEPGTLVSQLIATTPSLDATLFRSLRAIVPGQDADSGGLYVRRGSSTTPVTVAPVAGLPIRADQARPALASRDLSRVYVSGSYSPGGAQRFGLFLWRDGQDAGRTVDVAAPRTTGAGPAAPVTLNAVSLDGRVAIFTTATRLLDADTDGGPDVYRYTLPEDGDASAGTLELLSHDAAGDAAGDALFVTASDDGGRVYLRSSRPLTPGSAAAPDGAIYLHHDGALTRVAGLAPGDDEFVVTYGNQPPVRRTADGRVLVFRSRAAIDGAPGGTVQAFRFDADTGQIACASCAGGDAAGDVAFDGAALYYAAVGRNITADGGRVYFQTSAALQPADTNDATDVYEYDATTDAVHLVSDGKGTAGSQYFNNSDDGDDVLFLTRHALVPQDENGDGGALRLYDARVGGGFPATVPATCAGDACRPAATPPPPSPGQPGSTAVGGGNVVTPPSAHPPRLALGRVSAAASRRLARTGRLTVRVTGIDAPATLRTWLTRGSSRVTPVGRRSIRSATGATVRLRLTAAQRRALRRRKSTTLTIHARLGTSGATATRTVVVRQAR